MRALLLAAPLLVATLAAAQSQPVPGSLLAGSAGSRMPYPTGNPTFPDLHSTPAPNLASPPGGEDQRASDYLKAAQGALAAGRATEAQQALEMAQTRMLDRSVPMGQTDNPSDNPTVQQISKALQALAARDRATCMQQIQAAIGTATAQGY